MKTKLRKLISAITVFVFIASIPLVVSAKPDKDNGGGPKNPPSIQKKVNDRDPKNAPQPKAKDNNNGKENSQKNKQNIKKPFVPKNNWDKQLTGTEKKLAEIEKGVNDIKVKIDQYILVPTSSAITITPSAINATPPAITVTPAAITTPVALTIANTTGVSTTNYVYGKHDGNKKQDIKGFVNGMTGKLKALSNRLSAVERELKSLEKKVSKDAADKYKELTAKTALIKGNISAQLKRLQTMLPSKTTIKPTK